MAVTTTHTRRYVFQAVHRLNALNEGKHGHHFYVEISFSGGDRNLADLCFNDYVAAKLHGREISPHIAPPTGENIVEWIHGELLKSPLGPHLRAVRLQETDKNLYISAKSEARFV